MAGGKLLPLPESAPLADAVQVSLQRLSAAGLLKATRPGIGTGVDTYRLTSEGEKALAAGSVLQHLATPR